mgnify:CR=1 FL=1
MRKGWEYKKLGEVCEVVTGTTPKTNIPEYWGKGHYWVTPAELNDTTVYIDKTERQITDEALSKTKLRLLPVGTVLLSSRAPIGKVAIANAEMYCNQGFKNCICSEAINNKYLFYFLRLKKDYLNSLGRGATFKEISKSIVESIKIPLPPKSTQLAIVSELDKINELIRLKKEQLKDFDNLAQSLFYEMFGDPVENEKGWEVKKLGEVCTDIKYGTSKPASENGRYTYLRMCNLTTDGFLDLSNTKQIDIPDDEIEKCIVRYGDILFNRTNSIELVGKTCLFDQKEPMVIAGYIIRVRLNDTLLPVVLARMFNLASIKKLLRSMAKGAVNQANINSKELASIRIPLPPLPLQRLFAQRIEQIEREKSEVQKSIQDLETLLASRMQYWFE